MTQFFHGVIPLYQVKVEIEKLMTDAFLYINNEPQPLEIKQFKQFIYSLKLTAKCEKYKK